MNEKAPDNGLRERIQSLPEARGSVVRLIVIPFLIFIVWVLETFLLEGSLVVFLHYQPGLLVMYTLITTIFIGIFAPVLFLRSAFLSGAVNMYQVGFRSFRRTVLTTGVTACLGFLILATLPPFSSDRNLMIGSLLLMLPTAVSSVMVCWVLVGTHLQAYVRNRGPSVSILTGVLVTGVVFGLSFLAHSPPLNSPPLVLTGIITGMASAIFFFSVRDVCSAAAFVAFSLAWIMGSHPDPLYQSPVSPLLVFTALLSVFALAGSQWYLSRHFITVRIPVRSPEQRRT